jgi:hypothetical protein
LTRIRRESKPSVLDLRIRKNRSTCATKNHEREDGLDGGIQDAQFMAFIHASLASLSHCIAATRSTCVYILQFSFSQLLPHILYTFTKIGGWIA